MILRISRLNNRKQPNSFGQCRNTVRAEHPDSTDLLPAGSLDSWQERIHIQDFTVANIKQSAKTQSKVAVSGGKQIW